MSKLAGVVVAVDGRENGKQEGRQSQAKPKRLIVRWGSIFKGDQARELGPNEKK